jgi:hypothetical protein
MTAHTATWIGLVFSFIGTVFLVLDSIRISKRILRDGLTLADGGVQKHWTFRYASALGFGLLFAGFAFQAYALLRS